MLSSKIYYKNKITISVYTASKLYRQSMLSICTLRQTVVAYLYLLILL